MHRTALKQVKSASVTTKKDAGVSSISTGLLVSFMSGGHGKEGLLH